MTDPLENASSVPGFGEYSPEPIPWQDTFVDDVLVQHDYKRGVHESLLSGAYGSAKTMAAAHLACRICFDNKNALGLIARRTLGDLRDTIYRKIRDHLRNDKSLIEGLDYACTDSTCTVRFPRTGSEIIARSWHDNDFESVRSLDLTFLICEEASELEDENKLWYEAAFARIGRTSHIPQAFAFLLCNPGDPEHWLYKRFKLDLDEDPEHRMYADTTERPETRHVYYSVTRDNPFLPPWYYRQQLASLDPDEAERLLHGRWRPVRRVVIYHQYAKALNYRSYSYKIVPGVPLRLSFDFNIGEGKPMSACAAQLVQGRLHIFRDFVAEGFNTEAMLTEIAESGLFDMGLRVIIHGDATGRAKSTNSNHSDWELAERFIARYRTPAGHSLEYTMAVPHSNPRIRHRHNRVNAWLCNALGERCIFVYKDAAKVDEGLRLTKLKKAANITEDDTKDYQHVTTAVGYMVCSIENEIQRAAIPAVQYM